MATPMVSTKEYLGRRYGMLLGRSPIRSAADPLIGRGVNHSKQHAHCSVVIAIQLPCLYQ